MSGGESPETIEPRTWVSRALSLGRTETDEGEGVTTSVGDLELAPFQCRAVERGLTIARRYGGMLLADAVGLGKTRVSLGVARALARDARLRSGRERAVLFCVPARLRDQWRRKARKGGVSSPRVVSHTELSRHKIDVDSLDPGVVVVDEAHRFRNPDTNRSRQLAELCSHASVVLATATPVCNSVWDLYHLLSLFLAEHDLRGAVGCDLEDAFESAEEGEFDLTELVEHLVIRRTRAPSDEGFGDRPAARLEMLRYEPGEDETWVWEHLEPTLRDLSLEACAGQWPRELFVEYTLRRWESGPEALTETLESLVEYHRRWLEARRHGRTLNREDFAELFDDLASHEQEVFPFLFPEDDSEGAEPRGDAEAVRRDLERLQSLRERIERLAGRATGPARAIVELARSIDDKILVFTGYRRAAEGIFEALRRALGGRARLGLATGDTARATGLGRTSIPTLLDRFAPNARELDPPPLHQQLRILVSTDCLSRGVNLQDCGRIVLADLPYSPLAVEQRVGRLLRPGGPHEVVHVHVPRPDNWNDTLGLRRRLHRKLSHARRSGTGFTSADVLDVAAASNNGNDMTRDDLARPESQSRTARGGGRAEGAHRRANTTAPDDRPEGPHAGREAAPEPGPEQIARATDEDEPLAALTKLDGLARRLNTGDVPDLDDFWRGKAPIETDVLWIRTVFEHSNETRHRWGLVRSGERNAKVEWRTSRLVRGLVALADARLPLTRSAPPSDLLEAAREALDSRCRRLEAAGLAPVPLRLDSPQRQWWERICEWSESGDISRSDRVLETLRRRLLRPFPRGIERQLNELLDGDPAPRMALRRIESIVERHPVRTGDVSARIVGGLHLLPTRGRE